MVGSEIRVEQRGPQRLQFPIQFRLAADGRDAVRRALETPAGQRRRWPPSQFVERKLRQNLCAVISLWLPRLAQKQLSEGQNPRVRRRRMADDGFQQPLLAAVPQIEFWS